MEIVTSEIEKYCEQHSEKESNLLQRINRETHLEVLMPRMLSGHLQGRFLALMSRMINPKHILEVGTFTGYATLCLAEGLKDKGKLITIDINEELAPRVLPYFEASEKSTQIHFMNGNALEIIPTLYEKFDLVFIDADKKNYSRYYDLIFDKVHSGGYIIADNVLWSGKVVENKEHKDADTIAMDEYNKKVASDNRVEAFLLPLRDGLNICRKK